MILGCQVKQSHQAQCRGGTGDFRVAVGRLDPDLHCVYYYSNSVLFFLRENSVLSEQRSAGAIHFNLYGLVRTVRTRVHSPAVSGLWRERHEAAGGSGSYVSTGLFTEEHICQGEPSLGRKVHALLRAHTRERKNNQERASRKASCGIQDTHAPELTNQIGAPRRAAIRHIIHAHDR